MKLFLKILGGFLALLVVLIIGLNLYFTNDRLQNMLIPHINEAVGRTVEVESMSVTFFSTLPQPGVEVNNLSIPGEAEGDTLVSLDQLVVGVDLFSLFGNNISFSEIELNQPQFTYKIFADSTTNLDFLLNAEESDTAASGGYGVNIPYFQIIEGHFGYQDFTSHTSVSLHNLNGDLSLSYADSIQSSIDVEVQQVSATVDSTNYLDSIPLSLTEESTFYPNEEIIQLREGTFAIRGLEMDLVGTLSNWSKAFTMDLQFNSSSDNFGDLLALMPENEYTQGLETEGSLDLGGTLKGSITEEEIPNFDIRMLVQNGYLKDPDLPQPIEDIRISASATNELVTIDTLNVLAGANALTGSGTLKQPLEDNGTFNMDFVADVDLSTVNEFYNISELSIQQLAGQLDVDANAEGQLDQPEQATFEGKAMLADGLLKYQDVPKAITNINIDASGTQDLLAIRSLGLQAAENSFSAEGEVQDLLDDASRRINDMNTNLNFDLATIKEFYPIDEDTLRLEGMLTAQAILDGKADQIERAVQSGSINLKDGLVDYGSFDAPFRNITLDAVLEGTQMTIVEGSFQSGDNDLQASGVINNYISENRSLNIKAEGSAKLKEISNYYNLEPGITDLSGDADFNLSVKGPANNPAEMDFSGELMVENGNMAGESLREPVKNLNGTFSLSPQKASLSNLTFEMGASDIDLQGALSNYMAYLKDENNRTVTPQLTGQYYSKYLDLDQLIDWSDTTSTSFNLELPDLNSNFSAQIDRMKITGVTMQNLQAKATSTPEQVNLTQADVELFEGKASGTMRWQIPANQPSTFNFKGSLDSLRLESFFEEYPILGQNSQFYKFISGTFSTNVDYTTKIDDELNPLIKTTMMDGTFGMSKAQVQNHPLQQKLANVVKIQTLEDVALDQWKSSINIDSNVLTISDLSLTSNDIGLNLDGTQNLQSDNIDFHISLILPGRFKSNIASVITSQAANALARDNNTIMVPLRITGNYSNPKIQPDQTVIQPIVKKYLKNKAGNAIKNLFGGDDNEAEADTAQADTTNSN
jgi:hypothetical protein